MSAPLVEPPASNARLPVFFRCLKGEYESLADDDPIGKEGDRSPRGW